MEKSNTDIIQDIQKVIVSIYKEHEISSLKGLHDDFVVNGRQVLSWYFDIVRKGRCKYYQTFDFNQNFDDLSFCSDEVMYFLAHMYLYRPHINNPLKDARWFGEGFIYPNYQNLEAKRYSMFSNIVCEKLYNYWDRIGDLLAAYFPNLLRPDQVFFPKIIELIPEIYHNDENYKWLKGFKEDQYRKLNKIRKQIVHYTTEDTQFKNKHLGGARERDKIEQLFRERYSLADIYKAQLNLAMIGFEKCLLLIELVTEKTLSDIP